MARMFPESGPASGTTSKAERMLYVLLAETLGDDYAVFHGLRWETREHGDRLMRRESDFLIASRAHGLLLLEVKGGKVRRSGTGNSFTKGQANSRANVRANVRANDGKEHTVRDPFEQARSLVPLLSRHLWTAPLTHPYAPRYRIGYGVWVPDTIWRRGHDAAEDALVLDRSDLTAPEAGLLRLFAHFEREGGVMPLGDEAFAALRETLGSTVKVQSRLAVQIEGEERRISELTAEQFEILQALARYPRLAVSGAAGTGKTVLAYEKARRLAAQGLDVLLLCANPSLANWLDGRAKAEPVALQPHLTILDTSALCARILALSGTLRESTVRNGATNPVDAAEGKDASGELARLLAGAIRTVERRGDRMPFDAILVDEAQDVDAPLWAPLQQLLRDREGGLLYIFYDEAQRDGEGSWRVPLGGEKALLPLVVNLRNTRAIFDVMMRFYTGPDAPICRGPEGRAPVYVDPATLPAGPAASQNGHPVDAATDAVVAAVGGVGRSQNAPTDGEAVAENATAHNEGMSVEREVRALRLALDHLVDAEGVLPEDILIITCRSQRRSRWYTAEHRQIGPHRLIQRPEGGRPGRIALSTVRSAKGLERKVVVLTELDGLDGFAKRDTLLYVAISRAVHHLVVLGPEKALQPIGRKGRSGILAAIRGR